MKQSFNLAIIGIIQIITAVIPQILIVRLTGVEESTDVFFASQTISSVISTILIPSLSSVWLHKLSSSVGSMIDWRVNLGKSLGQSLILSLVFVFFTLLFLKPLISFMFPGFSLPQRDQAILFIFIFLIQMIFMVLSSQLSNAMRSKGQFSLVEVITLISSILALVLTVIFLPTFGLTSIALIMLFKAFFTFSIQWHYVQYQRPLIFISLKDSYSWSLIKPTLSGSPIYKLAPIVDRYWLSFSPSGFITLFGLCNSLTTALLQLLQVSIVSPRTAMFGILLHKGEIVKYKKSLFNGLYILAALVGIYILILLILKGVFINLSVDLLKLRYSDAEILWVLSLIYTLYLFSSAAGAMWVSAFNVNHDTKTPVILGLISFFFSLITKALSFIYFGPFGLVFAISFYYLSSMILQFIVYERKFGSS